MFYIIYIGVIQFFFDIISFQKLPRSSFLGPSVMKSRSKKAKLGSNYFLKKNPFTRPLKTFVMDFC